MPNMTSRTLAVVAVACLGLAGCASGPEVRGDYDKAADFGKYRTYGFMEHAATGTGDVRSLATQALQAAAAREMESRGYTKSDTPDLVINFKGRVEEKTDIQSTPAPYYGPTWGYRGYYGAAYGGYGGSEVTTRHYKVGTIVMDVVDREQRQVVYQGGVEGVVTKEMLQDRQATLTAAVGHIYSKYPFVAGQSAPVPLADEKK